MHRIVLLLSLTALLGCPACSGSGGKLTCDLLADPTNCWAEAAVALRACLPAVDEVGQLAADRHSCTFSDGSQVIFDQNLPLRTDDLETFGFTIETGGQTCGSFLDTFQNRMELEAGGRSVVSQLHLGAKFELDCGGTSYTSDFDLLFDCQPGTQPTDSFEVTESLVTFKVWSVNTPDALFRCAP